ncbi:PEP-CTERM sorting domain-containing protein [Ideonella sp.]|uniref:PEP-CTERM sorting domain-containing protein n=1 Tax=Ideonella sp. TaxID=1929293 RepID=UPI0035AE3653
MNLMCGAVVIMVLAAGPAGAALPQPHRDMRDDHWGSVAGHPIAGADLTGSDWAQRIDFASAANGPLQPVAWSPPPVRADFDHLPPPALPAPLADTADPLGPMPRSGDTGAALAGDIVAEDGLAHLGEVLAVPEPSALLMMLAGLGAIAFVIRRRINDA